MKRVLIITQKETKLENSLDTTQFESVRLSRAIIPWTIFNICRDLKNTIFQYVTDDENQEGNTKVIYLKEGYYSVEDINDVIHKEMRKQGTNPANINFEYDPKTGHVMLTVKKPYMVYLRELGELLGFPHHTLYIEGEYISHFPCRMSIYTTLYITCSLVSRENILNDGKSSNLLAVLPLTSNEFGKIMYFEKPFPRIPIHQYEHTAIKMDIVDRLGFPIPLKEAATFVLTLK